MREPLDREALHEALVTPGSPWQGLDVHAELGSTNAAAAELAQPWRVVVADHQSAGRGRLGRSWEAPPGTSIAVAYLEGTPTARRLLEVGRKSRQTGKPVMIWKAATTDAGIKAAASHTANMTGSADLYRAAEPDGTFCYTFFKATARA